MNLKINLPCLLMFCAYLAATTGCGSSTPATGPGPNPTPPAGQLNQVGAWNWANPRPQGAPVNRIEYASDSVLFAVSDGGSVLKSSDAGNTWEVAYRAFEVQVQTNGRLFDLFFVDANRGWVVGGAGQVSYTMDGGATWIDRSVNTIYDIRSVYFHDEDNGFVVDDGGSIHRSNDGGTTWASVYSPPSVMTLNTVLFSSPSIGWAAGDDATVLRSDDAGATWTLLDTVWTDKVTHISRLADDKVVLGTAQGSLYESLGPGDWSHILAKGTILGLAFEDAANGIVLYMENDTPHLGRFSDSVWEHGPLGANISPRDVTQRGNRLAIAGWDGRMSVSADEGVTWQTTSNHLPNEDAFSKQLFDVVLDDAGLGIAVGSDGSVVRTTDNGVTWSDQSSGTTEDLYSVSLKDGVAFAVGRNLAAIRSTNGGQSWSPVTLPIDVVTLWGVAQFSATSVMIVGDRIGLDETILVSHNRGQSWSRIDRGVTAARNFYDVCALTGSIALLGSESGKIVFTPDMGQNWSERDSGTSKSIRSIHFYNGVYGWGTTQSSQIVYTRDGAVTWELGIAPRVIWDVHFGTPDVGIGVGTSGEVLTTNDGGASWARVSSGVWGSSHVRSVWMTSPTDGVLVGTELKILYTRSAGLPPVSK